MFWDLELEELNKEEYPAIYEQGKDFGNCLCFLNGTSKIRKVVEVGDDINSALEKYIRYILIDLFKSYAKDKGIDFTIEQMQEEIKSFGYEGNIEAYNLTPDFARKEFEEYQENKMELDDSWDELILVAFGLIFKIENLAIDSYLEENFSINK